MRYQKEVLKELAKLNLPINTPKFFEFDVADLLPLWLHAIKAKDHRMGYGLDPKEKKEPALMLVKDSGAYMMSNGVPGRKPKKKGGNDHVAYAKGCRPEDGHIPGGDFVEVLFRKEDMQTLIDHYRSGNITKVRIRLTENFVKIETI
jgi:hypothetical protein